jgi:CDP-diacylglycerol--glycerol-3-phosphate 3-phosphatidyltransferase
MKREFLRDSLSKYYEEPLAGLFDALGFSPNGVTLIGLLIVLISSIFIAWGQFLMGGILMLTGAALDLIDGGLARRKGMVTNFGALLDSVIDRLQEALVLLAIMVYYLIGDHEPLLGLSRIDVLGPILSFTAFVGSIMVSYMRARSEGLGIECKTGIMTRPERVVTLGTGLILGFWFPVSIIIVLTVLTVLGIFTTFQRLYHSSIQVGD